MFFALRAESPCSLCASRESFLVSAKVRSGEKLRTVVCAQCGLGRRDPMPSEAELRDFYASGYRIEIGKGRRPSKGRLWRIAAAGVTRATDVLRHLPGGNRPSTLDAGCGAGELVYMLAQAGCQARGFDPDSHYMEWAQRVIGPNVERNHIEDVQVPAASLDVVTMYHVLEHMRDPRTVVRQCAAWIKEGGSFIIEVPNLESTVQAPGHQFLKVHVHYFNQATLTALASEFGLTLESGGGFDHGENLRCYFRKRSGTTALPPANPENVQRVLAILAGHRTLQHFLTVHPYRRVGLRLSRTLREFANSFWRSDAEILQHHAARLQSQLRDSGRGSIPAAE